VDGRGRNAGWLLAAAAPVNPEAFSGCRTVVSAIATWVVAFRTYAAAPGG
jgi:hypothetical protein